MEARFTRLIISVIKVASFLRIKLKFDVLRLASFLLFLRISAFKLADRKHAVGVQLDVGVFYLYFDFWWLYQQLGVNRVVLFVFFLFVNYICNAYFLLIFFFLK